MYLCHLYIYLVYSIHTSTGFYYSRDYWIFIKSPPWG
jgi:hypothetical protein